MLLYNTRRKRDISTILKLTPRWLGLYRIQQADQKKGTYLLEKLNDTLLYNIFPNNRLKKFVIREHYIYTINKSQLTASLEGGEKENLSDNNNQLEHPYIEEEDDSRYISSGRLFAVLI